MPRRSARRRIPLHAFALKENRCGSVPVSKTSDNEHTPPSLRDGAWVPLCSDPLSVQHPVGPPIPQLPQRPEEGTKVPSSSARQDSGDILPDNPSRPKTPSDLKVCEHECTALLSLQHCAGSTFGFMCDLSLNPKPTSVDQPCPRATLLPARVIGKASVLENVSLPS